MRPYYSFKSQNNSYLYQKHRQVDEIATQKMKGKYTWFDTRFEGEVAIKQKKENKREAHQAERRQLSSVITYGMLENFSVDLLIIILLNVILYKPQI